LIMPWFLCLRECREQAKSYDKLETHSVSPLRNPHNRAAELRHTQLQISLILSGRTACG
jgi:hypothetical protein